MRAHEIERKYDYLFNPEAIKEILLNVLGKPEDRLSRGEQMRIQKLFDHPKLNYDDMKRIIQGGWGNVVWLNVGRRIEDRSPKREI